MLGRVIRVAKVPDGNDGVPVLGEGLVRPNGIAGYPSQVSDAGGLGQGSQPRQRRQHDHQGGEREGCRDQQQGGVQSLRSPPILD